MSSRYSPYYSSGCRRNHSTKHTHAHTHQRSDNIFKGISIHIYYIQKKKAEILRNYQHSVPTSWACVLNTWWGSLTVMGSQLMIILTVNFQPFKGGGSPNQFPLMLHWAEAYVLSSYLQEQNTCLNLSSLHNMFHDLHILFLSLRLCKPPVLQLISTQVMWKAVLTVWKSCSHDS